MMKNKEMVMKTHKENCISHIVAKFEERFTKEDFAYEDKWGRKIDLKELIVSSIINAPRMGNSVGGGKGNCTIFKISYNNIKPVFVVWNMVINCAVTVLTGEMWDCMRAWDKKKSV